MSKKRILILNTGGTISSVPTKSGYAPKPGYVKSYLAECNILTHDKMPEYVLYEYEPLLDSSNITLMNWNKIGRDIAKHYQEFDGFVIFHGTDTMAYTASALSFMLENLNKPVILTGSQMPLYEVRNDALENIMTALWLAANTKLNEVCIYFNQRLLRGNRAQKMSSENLRAFESPNFPELADFGIHVSFKEYLLLSKPKNAFFLQELTSQFIANFRIFPGFSTDILKQLLLQPDLKALIIETYGSGNAPNQDKEFLEILRKACDKGIIIVNCTQCVHGSVIMGQYATGIVLQEIGIISAGNMTSEALHCKLLYLLSKYSNASIIKEHLVKSLRGEIG